jgi:hypothetical protein
MFAIKVHTGYNQNKSNNQTRETNPMKGGEGERKRYSNNNSNNNGV